MIRTPVCDLIGIEFPIIQAGMGPFTSAELVAAVSDAGALGSLGAGARTLESLKEQLAKTQSLTNRPFAINHTLSPLLPNPEAFSLSLKAKPRLISFALGNPKEYVQQVHDAGILVMHQVTTVQQAYQAAEGGVDIIIAQGAEAGGFGGAVSGLVLTPQIVDAVSPIPVIAAGGIADGRGFAAALVLGAQGVNVGTRFLASVEAPISDSWKHAILGAESQDAVKVEFWNDIYPPGEQAYYTIPRTLSSPFIKKWQNHEDKVKQEISQLNNEIISAIQQGKFGELFPFTGQSTGQIKEVLPAAEIVRRLVNEAEATLKRMSQLTN
jgi:enoyl-[acyl-carrier protein] reductase II